MTTTSKVKRNTCVTKQYFIDQLIKQDKANNLIRLLQNITSIENCLRSKNSN